MRDSFPEGVRGSSSYVAYVGAACMCIKTDVSLYLCLLPLCLFFFVFVFSLLFPLSSPPLQRDAVD